MDERDKILMAHDWVRKLANGINPLTGNTVKEDDVVNNVHISRCLFYVADLLGKHTEKRSRPNSSRTSPFTASAVQKEKYNYVDAISISAFAREIEKLIPEDMKAIGYTLMTNWLVQRGLLRESEPDINGRTFKIASEKGKEIGIYSEDRESEGRGHYTITLYNRDAQRYLLDHLEEISQVQ